MKIQNPIKLIIKFIGGGVIKFPTKHLRWIDIEPINGSDDEDDKNITLITNDEFNKKNDANIFVKPEIHINYDGNEDLILDIFKLTQNNIENINNSIYDSKKSKINMISTYSNVNIFIDKFEILNEYEENSDEFQTVKIHIHKTAVILPIHQNLL